MVESTNTLSEVVDSYGNINQGHDDIIMNKSHWQMGTNVKHRNKPTSKDKNVPTINPAFLEKITEKARLRRKLLGDFDYMYRPSAQTEYKRYKWKDGSCYEGEFVDGNFNGRGVKVNT